MATSSSLRTFHDPVHGSIQLEPYLVKIIDTLKFQRLRKIKQQGIACFVYPGAIHTRFEHSIGVCHIAGHLITKLNENQAPNKKDWKTGDSYKWFSEEEEKCVKIAALCHDLGHGPYSHLYDHVVEKHLKDNNERIDEKAKHEYRSALIVEMIINDLKQQQDPDFVKFQDENIKLIQAMIKFSEEYKEFCEGKCQWDDITNKTPKCKSYLFEIVANGFTGIDVDKMDYFARDNRSAGLPNSFDWRRFVQTARIIKCGTDGFYHICSRDKDAMALYEMFHTRNAIHRTVCRHKTVVIIDHMTQTALGKANEGVKIKDQPLLKCWANMDSFTLLTDAIEDIIMNGSGTKTEIMVDCGKVEESRKWLKRIKTRELPKFVGRTPACTKAMECKCTQAYEKRAKEIVGVSDYDAHKLIAKPEKFSYGKGANNPMKMHYFYSKHDPMPGKPHKLSSDEVSTFLPKNFQETEIFWYYDGNVAADDTEDKLTKLRHLFTEKSNNSDARETDSDETECTCPDDKVKSVQERCRNEGAGVFENTRSRKRQAPDQAGPSYNKKASIHNDQAVAGKRKGQTPKVKNKRKC